MKIFRYNVQLRLMTFLVALLLPVLAHDAQALDLGIMQVNFDAKQVRYANAAYELVEVNVKQKCRHREVTYICIDSSLHAVAFRLYQADNGKFIKLVKMTCKSK